MQAESRKQSKSNEANTKYQELYIHGKLMCDVIRNQESTS